MSAFRLPDLGEGLLDAEIVTWHVGPGEHVVADQPLVAVETDKAVVEIPAPWSGHITIVHGEEGDIVRVGDLLVEFADSEVDDVGAIVGEFDRSERITVRPPAQPAEGPIVRATPAVRAEARRLGIDLAGVVGTGPQGTILGTDLAGTGPQGTILGTDLAGTVAEPLRGAASIDGGNMARAHTLVVPATVTEEADVGSWPAGEVVLLRLIRATAAACRTEPSLNVSFHGPEIGRSTNATVDLGIAMDSKEGLFVPVLRDVGHRSADDLRAELDSVKAQVRSRSLPPDRLRGQTITLSNFGSLGGRHGALVVIPPQVAIIGAGSIRDAVLARAGRPTVRPVLPLSLTFDHRVVTGGEATRFLIALVTDLELAS